MESARLLGGAVRTSLSLVCLLTLLACVGTAYAASPSSPSITVSPSAGPVGSTITVIGVGYPASTSLNLEWNSAKANWVVTGNPPEVSGTRIVPIERILATVESNSTGSFTVRIVVPPDFGGQHFIQGYTSNGTALVAKATYTLEPSFHIAPTSGPDGAPITVTATGLGDGLYSTSYHLYWDNGYAGYMTAITTGGSTNFTIYASGVPGVHYIQVFQGYPGPGYLNPQQGPPASETQSSFPPLIPYLAEFTVTASSPQGAGTSSIGGLAASGPLAVVAVVFLAGGFLLASPKDPERRQAISRIMVVIVIVVLLAATGVALYSQFGQPLSASQTSTNGVTGAFVAQTAVVRPEISVPVSNATTGPRISVSPSVAGVGDTIAISGSGFEPSENLALTWATREGNNLRGYQLVDKPLRNVTASGSGSFNFAMKVPYDLGGLHFVSAGKETENSNGTFFLQRTCSLSSSEGPVGTKIVITCVGVGWDYNTNIIAVDYDNSYFGYACGFNSGGNATVTLVATGAPGVHTVDVYPSVWWGPSGPTSQLVTEYRYPLLTPQDHPELMPSFHFTFLLTGAGGGNTTQTQGAAVVGGFAILGSYALLPGAGGTATGFEVSTTAQSNSTNPPADRRARS